MASWHDVLASRYLSILKSRSRSPICRLGIVKAIRRIAQLRRRLAELERELEAHRQTAVFGLRQTVEASEARGEDPLGKLARELKAQISRFESELEAMGAVARP